MTSENKFWIFIVGIITAGVLGAAITIGYYGNLSSIRNNEIKVACIQKGGTPVSLANGGISCTFGSGQ